MPQPIWHNKKDYIQHKVHRPTIYEKTLYYAIGKVINKLQENHNISIDSSRDIKTVKQYYLDNLLYVLVHKLNQM